MPHPDASSTTDAAFLDLLRRARSGSTDALGQLFQRIRSYLLQVANEQIDTELQAKAGGSDLVQQTFLEAQRDLSQFQGSTEADLLAWMRGILQNNIANFIRHYRETSKRQIRLESSLTGDGSSANLAGELASPQVNEPTYSSEQVLAMIQAIERLPPDYREVIVRRYRDHQSFAAIGAALGRSAEAARKLWTRAVLRLQQEMDPGT